MLFVQTMVDPSKDQFYQQQLAPWSHLGGASPYGSHPLPATHQSHMYGAPPRLNHSFPGLVPEAPSPAPPPPHAPTTSTSHHGAAAHPYYPMHLAAAALSAAAVAASDFSRPLPAHSPATAGHSSSGGAAAASAPLPAHLSRNPYQNYHHHAYMPSYYGNHHTPMSQPAAARDANGYNPPPSSYASIGNSKDLHSANVYNLSKNREPQHQATSDDRNGYKTTTADRGGASSQFQPFPAPYPGAALPHNTAATPTVPSTQSHSGYHYPFDMSKLGYQFGHQQPPQSHLPPGVHHHPQQHPQPPSAHPPPHPPQPPPSSLAHPAGATAAAEPSKGEKGRSSNGINSSAQSSQNHPVQATNLGPPKPNFSSHYLDQFATHPSIKQLLPQKPHPPAAPTAGNTTSPTATSTTPLSAPLLPATTTSHDHVKPTTPSAESAAAAASTAVAAATSSGIGGALSVPNINPTIHHQRLAKTYEASNTNKGHLQTAIENSNMSPHPAIRDTNESKRKASIDAPTTVGASVPSSTEPPPKKPKLVNHDLDPYNFDEEDSIGNTTTKPIVDSNGIVELTRFGSSSSAIKSESPASSPGGSSYSVYKFKSALLSRNSGGSSNSSSNLQDLPKLSSKSVPLTFENVAQTNMFIEACDRFMEDLNSKPMSVSKRASIESFAAAQATRAAIKADKKAEKEQQKVQAAERKAEREDRKEKERLGLIPPKAKKRSRKSSSTNKKDPDQPQEAGAEDIATTVDDGNDTTVDEGNDFIENDIKENQSSDDVALADQDSKGHQPPSSPPPVVSATATNNNNSNSSLQQVKVEEKPKKGGTWALPIVPKMPQKPQGEKRKGLAPLPNIPMPAKTKKSEVRPKSSSTKSSAPTPNTLASGGGSGNAKAGGGGLANVWLQAFGAKPSVTKTPKQEPVESKEKLREVKVTKKTYLDIPPELRRRPKPKFGGLIHFSPDWERAVQKYHERARMPETLVDGIKVNYYLT